MSGGGFLPDLASWALGGGAGGGSSNHDSNNNNNHPDTSSEAPLTEQEMRARRLARMEQAAAGTTAVIHNSTGGTSEPPRPMDISPPRKNATTTMDDERTSTTTSNNNKYPPSSSSSSPTMKKAKETHSTTTLSSPLNNNDPSKRLQRRKELVIKKILQISLTNGIILTNSQDDGIATGGGGGIVMMELDDPIPLGVHSIAELLANRLALPMDQIQTIMSSSQPKPLLNYLAAAHKGATEELRTLYSSVSSSTTTTTTSSSTTIKKSKEGDEEILALLKEIQNQVVSYAATSLMEPDLFEQAFDGVDQLTKALMASGLDPTHDFTFGVAGPASSFYQHLCEELHSQDEASFARILHQVIWSMMQMLKKCDSLDSGVGDTSPLGIVSALTNVCANKKAAFIVSKLDGFLVPPEGTPQAADMIQPPMLPGSGADLMRMFSAENRPYQRRSGPGIEKETLLGLALRITTPKSNPAFAPTNILRQKLETVERTTNQQRQQLHMYQESCHQLIMNLIKGGSEAREQVLAWFVDCQLVNTGATAMRPDVSKVSSPGLLLNVSVELLKLCDPFISQDSKHKLIDPGFVSLSDVGALIFPTTGDAAIPRLGESSSSSSDGEDSPMMDTTAPAEYAPKNTFVPQVFFMTARSLALGIVPQLSSHENLLRHISHQHWELNSQNRDVFSDPHFSMMVSRQRSSEVTLFQEEMTTDTIRFINLMSKILVGLSDDVLKKMPEHFVDNICDVLMSLAKLKPRSLRGMDVGFAFSLMVKLLSPKYKSVSVFTRCSCCVPKQGWVVGDRDGFVRSPLSDILDVFLLLNY
jgi:Ubiquitin elongating factor core